VHATRKNKKNNSFVNPKLTYIYPISTNENYKWTNERFNSTK